MLKVASHTSQWFCSYKCLPLPQLGQWKSNSSPGVLCDERVLLCLIYSVLGTEPRALCMLDKHYSKWATYPAAKICLDPSPFWAWGLQTSPLLMVPWHRCPPYLRVACSTNIPTTFIIFCSLLPAPHASHLDTKPHTPTSQDLLQHSSVPSILA